MVLVIAGEFWPSHFEEIDRCLGEYAAVVGINNQKRHYSDSLNVSTDAVDETVRRPAGTREAR